MHISFKFYFVSEFLHMKTQLFISVELEVRLLLLFSYGGWAATHRSPLIILVKGFAYNYRDNFSS